MGSGRAVLETSGLCQSGRRGRTQSLSAALRGAGASTGGPAGQRFQAWAGGPVTPAALAAERNRGPLHGRQGQGQPLSLGRPGGREQAGGVPPVLCRSPLREGTSGPLATRAAAPCIPLPGQMR